MSNLYLCIRCWRSEPEPKLFAECPTCSQDPLVTVMETRMRLEDLQPQTKGILRVMSADEDDVMPHCRDHPHVPLRLFCVCSLTGTDAPLFLSSRLSVDEGLAFVGIAGARGCGKTTLMTAMMDGLDKHTFKDGRLAKRAVGQTAQRYERLRDRFLVSGLKPEGTPDASRDQDVGLAWRVSHMSDRFAGERNVGFVAFHDVGGETWSQLQSADKPDRFQQYLHRLTGLVFVVDGAVVADDLGCRQTDAWDSREEGPERTDPEGVLQAIVDGLAGIAKKIRLAVCITKADHLWQVYPHLKSLMQELDVASDGDATLGGIANNSKKLKRCLSFARTSFDDVRLFAASSIGFLPSVADIKVVSGDEKKLIRKIDPCGAVAPLHWLLQADFPVLRR